MQALHRTSQAHTQTTLVPAETSPLQVRFVLGGRVSTPPGLSQQSNIPQKASDLIQQIEGINLFTPEQKTFANCWGVHFTLLLTHTDRSLPAKAVCFLGIKVITPALVLYKDNRLASDQLIPIVRTQRELLILLLPENSDVEAFIIRREEIHHLMIETKTKLNEIIAINQENEQMIRQQATTMREKILNNSNRSGEILRKLVQLWGTEIGVINVKLAQLTVEEDILNKKFQDRSHGLEKVGTQLVAELQAFNGGVEELKNLLKKV